MSATSPSLAPTIRKRLDDDCLLEGELHPSIAERLNRVRELPVQAVANLHGVDRDEHGIWMVWQSVEGCTFAEYRKQEHTHEEYERVIRDLRLALAGMHAHGVVHGAVDENNVIIDPLGRVRLTHVSPLLYDEPNLDMAAVDKLAVLVGVGNIQTPISQTQESTGPETQRTLAYAAAAVSLLAGILIFVVVFWYIGK